MTTVRVLLEQEPSRLFLSFVEVSEPQRRRPSALPLRSHTPSAMFAVRSSAPPIATRRHFRLHTLPAIRFRSIAPASFGWRFRNLASVRHTPPAPILAGQSATALHLSTAHPHVFQI